jgi:tetratricopeptide (TPR) repeat protein
MTDDPAHRAAAAEAAFDWPAATAAYEDALSSLDRSDEAWPAREAELLTGLGRSYWRNAEVRPAWRTLMRAITSCKQRADAPAQARATLEVLRIWGPWERHKMLAEDALDALGDSEPYLRARLLWDVDRAGEAFAIAEQHGYDDVLAFRVGQQGWNATREGRLDEARDIAQQVHVAHDTLGNWEAAASALRGVGFSTLQAGEVDLAEPILRRSYEYAARHNLRFYEHLALVDVIGIAFARCQWDECERMLASIIGGADFRADLYRGWIAELRGDTAAVRGLLVEPERAGGSGDGRAQVHSARAGMLFRLGEHNAARAELDVMFTAADDERQGLNHYVPACVDAIVALCDDAAIRKCLAGMQPPEDERGRFDAGYVFSTLQGRPVHASHGALHLRLGDIAAAERHYTEGLAWAEANRTQLAAADCHAGLAAIAEQHGHEASAIKHQSAAAALTASHVPASASRDQQPSP